MNNSQKVRLDVPNHRPEESRAAYVTRLVEEAKLWSRFALDHSSLSRSRVQSMAMDAVSFSVSGRAHHLAIPTKLIGTLASQDALQAIAEMGGGRPRVLQVDTSGGRIEALYDGTVLGWIWPRHTWAWPLVMTGARLFLIRITGTSHDWKFLGCNVAVSDVAEAVRLAEGRGMPTPGEYLGGDGHAEESAGRKRCDSHSRGRH